MTAATVTVVVSALVGVAVGPWLAEVARRFTHPDAVRPRRRVLLAWCAASCAALATTAAWFGPVWHLPAFLYLAAVAVVLTVVDLAVRRLPDLVVLTSYVVGADLLAGASLFQADLGSVVRGAVGMAVLWGGYFALALLPGGGMGYGDVKLAGLLGMYLGWLGWSELVVGTVLGFVIGGLAGVALLALRLAGLTSAIPFGPSMLLGAAGGVVAGDVVADWYLG